MSMMHMYLAAQARSRVDRCLNVINLYKKLVNLLLKDRKDIDFLDSKRVVKINNLIKQIKLEEENC